MSTALNWATGSLKPIEWERYYMKNAILEVLNNETLTTTDERVEALTTALGPLVIPKDKFNEINNELKTVKSNYSTLSTEFDEFKKSKMTDDEKREAEKADMESRSKNLSLKESEYAVRDLFTNANVSKEKYEKILKKVVSENKDKSVEIAQTFIELLGETADETKKKTVTDLLNDTPKPTVSTPNSGTVSNMDDYQAKFDESVKNGDLVGQAQYLRLIQEEQTKLNTPGV